MRTPTLAALTVATLSLTACSPGATPSTPPPASLTSASQNLTPCTRPADPTATITATPIPNEWVSWGTAQHPVSTEFGGNETGPHGAPTCFEHSPTGALFAASTYSGAILSPPEFKKIILDHAHPQNQAQDLYQNFETTAQEAYSTLNGAHFIVCGYQLKHYDHKTATISIALGLENINDRYMVIELPLTWERQDWRINTQNANNLTQLISKDAQLITNLNGYTPWGPKTPTHPSTAPTATPTP